MCNLYSVTTNQAAIIALARAFRDIIGNMPTFPGIFPDYPAPIVRNAPDDVRELCIACRADEGDEKACGKTKGKPVDFKELLGRLLLRL